MVDQCVWELVPEHINEWGNLYGHYSKGFLLMDGGIGNQPERYLQFMSAFSSAYNKVHRERSDSMKK